MAKSTNEAPQSIISSAFEDCSVAAVSRLPLTQSLKRTVRSIRVQNNAVPALPRNCNELLFPDGYTKSLKGETFLAYDPGQGDKRMLIFATKRNLHLLSRSNQWFADGTFKTVPLLFHQLYTLHCLTEKASLPLVFALLPNKSEETYGQLLQKINFFLPSCTPSTVRADFEKAMQNAFLKNS